MNINNFKCERPILFWCCKQPLLDYAKFNILIPKSDSFKKNVEFLPEFDIVLAKSRYIESLFKTFVPEEKLKHIGWRSTDNILEKEYDEFLLFCS